VACGPVRDRGAGRRFEQHAPAPGALARHGFQHDASLLEHEGAEAAAEAGILRLFTSEPTSELRQAFGVTVCEYSRSLRLDWAATQLEGDVRLAQVALEAGFADQSHFTRAFRRHVGVTPGRYRELLRR